MEPVFIPVGLVARWQHFEWVRRCVQPLIVSFVDVNPRLEKTVDNVEAAP